MKTLIFVDQFNCTSLRFAPSTSLFHFPSFFRENTKFFRISPSKSLYFPKSPTYSAIKASTLSNSFNYGGWDDLQLGGRLVESGESNHLRDYLASNGFDDKKHVFVFLLGILCALSISRIRISSIIVFPAFVLVFAIGFSFGFVRGGSFSEFSGNANKRRAKEEFLRVYDGRLRSLVGFFDGFDVKVQDLKNDIQRAIDTKEIELGDLESYVNAIESLKSSALDTRNVVEATVDSVGNSNGVSIENQKSSSKKRKEICEVGFDLLQFVRGFFGGKQVISKPTKLKDQDNFKQKSVEGFANDQTQEHSSTLPIEQGILNDVDIDEGNVNSLFSKGFTNNLALDWGSERRIRIVSKNKGMNSGEIGRRAKRFFDNEEYSYQNNRLRYVNNDNQHVSQKMDQNNETETRKSQDNLLDSVDFSLSLKHMETKASFVQEQMFKRSSRAYRSSHSKKMNEDEMYRSQFREKRTSDDLHLDDHQSILENEVGSSSYSLVSDDVMFDRYLTESSSLLKQAKECISGRCDEDHAEIILYKSAKLLLKAITMKPMSLLAVGQLGNTYLLHGELKLKISRDLRTLLSRKDPLSTMNHGKILKGIDDQGINKDKIASLLVDVCEECEELLVEAGRKYRLALSIDGNDVRALYNWGLALFFRAQLIADIGPEAASDADKVFLAAIDKFDAMMSKGNIYAPDALFRWGVVLQQRSHLRPTNSKERSKLLLQAKRLYEDALDMDCDNTQVREALSSCIYELKRRLL